MNSLGLVGTSLLATGIALYAPSVSADTKGCSESRCSTAQASLKLEGRDALRTTIDTGWLPSCDGGKEHCNKGLQVRADIALSASTLGGPLFTAVLASGSMVQASWEDPKYLVLSTESIGKSSALTVAYSLTPQIELYLDIGPLEQGWAIPATRLLDYVPGSHFNYAAAASVPFVGWGWNGASVTVPAPTLKNTELFSVDLNKISDIFGKVVTGSIALHAYTVPTFTYKTTRITVEGSDLAPGASTQYPFPDGDYDYLELPATIEGELSAHGSIDVMPSATLSKLGDLNFSPATTITFSSVKLTKAYECPPQAYTFGDKVIRIPLPNVRRPSQGLDGGQVAIGNDGAVPVVFQNTGEASALVTLSSSDPRFVVPGRPVTLAPKSKRPIDISFRPDATGLAEATITAKTNDPDSPTFTFTVVAEGIEGLGTNGKTPGRAGDESAMTGCGCKTAGTSQAGYAGLGALLLGLVGLTRRRR